MSFLPPKVRGQLSQVFENKLKSLVNTLRTRFQILPTDSYSLNNRRFNRFLYERFSADGCGIVVQVETFNFCVQ